MLIQCGGCRSIFQNGTEFWAHAPCLLMPEYAAELVYDILKELTGDRIIFTGIPQETDDETLWQIWVRVIRGETIGDMYVDAETISRAMITRKDFAGAICDNINRQFARAEKEGRDAKHN